MTTLLAINAPHFYCAIELRNGRVVVTAPILKWMRGKTEDEVRRYCAGKGWKVAVIDGKDMPQFSYGES